MNTKHGWYPGNVSAQNVAHMAVRTLLEVRQLGEILSTLKFERGLDLGCGFGRLTMVLESCCQQVMAYEREPAMVELARSLPFRAQFEQVSYLDRLPESDQSFNFVMTYTVLQHIKEKFVVQILQEIKRVAAPGALVLLVENTNPHDFRRHKGFNAEWGLITEGRSVKWYKEQMHPFELVRIDRRVTESQARKRYSDGHLMLFEAPQ